MATVKDEIIRKNKSVILKNLFIKEEQCQSRIIKLFIDGGESNTTDICTIGDDTMKLRDLKIQNGE